MSELISRRDVSRIALSFVPAIAVAGKLSDIRDALWSRANSLT
jgi:hypothetical protein